MRWSRTLTLAVGLPVLIGVAALATGANRRFFDYDEIYHAHATWLIAHGLRPFHDFQASHTPFLWYPLAAVWRLLPESPSALIPLRYIGAGGALFSLIAMTASFAVVRREVPVTWWVVALCLVAFDPRILDYLLEFRPDSWSTALLFTGFFFPLIKRPSAVAWRYALFGVLATAAIIASPKLVLLPSTFAAVDLGARVFSREAIRPAFFGLAAGVGGMLLAALAFLSVAQIDPRLMFDMAIKYQWAVVQGSGFQRGLLTSVLSQPWLLALVVSGLLAWIAYLVRTRRRPATFEIAALVFLLAQLLIVDRPYKQYFAPWFLIATGFVPFLGLVIGRVGSPRASWALVAAIVVAVWTSWSALQGYRKQNAASEMLDFYDTLLRVSAATASIVAYPPLHPVFRRDVFYGWSRTTDPAGHGTEAIMASLNVPGYSQRFEAAYYRRELEARPPALIVAPRDANWVYEPAQWSVLKEYLAAHQDQYGLVNRGVLQPLWVRRDAVDLATLSPVTGRTK